MEKLQNETAMYARLVYIDTVGHADSTVDTHSTSRGRFFRFLQILFLREIVSLTFNGIYLGICKMLEEKIKKSQKLS
jgi:hypothetical protein